MTRTLLEVHAGFLSQSRMPQLPGRPPIVARTDRPIMPRERWVETGDPKELVKAFPFRRRSDRLRFLQEIIEFEEKVGHHSARTVLEADVITLHLRTKDVDRITEMDKELAQFADACYKDICFSPARG
jgi:pterin-4a-carbinolamine dehydratase